MSSMPVALYCCKKSTVVYNLISFAPPNKPGRKVLTLKSFAGDKVLVMRGEEKDAIETQAFFLL